MEYYNNLFIQKEKIIQQLNVFGNKIIVYLNIFIILIKLIIIN